MNSIFSLEGKTAIVTGCNSGMGQASAIAFAKAGADIVGVFRSDASDTRAAVEAAGKKFVPVHVDDLSSLDNVPVIIAAALDNFGKVDILLNNAGMILRNDSLDFTEQEWDAVLNLDLKLVFFLSQAAAKQFVRQGTGGKIINIASLLSFQGGIRVPSYTAAKQGVKGVTMALANEWAKYNINVNAIAPGYIKTKVTAALQQDKARYESILERIPAGRWGDPEDVAGTAVFLASPASDYINGFTIACDGGWLGR